MKQRIKIPDKVTHTVFSLPCVVAVMKDKHVGVEYHVRLEGRTWTSAAYPGDTLIEDDKGVWHLERRRP
jgi:hypothetical protein